MLAEARSRRKAGARISALFALPQRSGARAGIGWIALAGVLERPMRLEMSVDEMMRRWPATIPVFLSKRMLCVGCPVGSFHSVHEACLAHKVDEAAFEAELRKAIAGHAGAASAQTRC
jgi:hybrid cluster-associated redox disulfide protein